MNAESVRQVLEELYRRLNRPELVHPDPLEFLYAFENPLDREIVALTASSLAYGRVAQILKSVNEVLERLDGAPYESVLGSGASGLRDRLSGFRHRFTRGEELAAILSGASGVIREYGSLGCCLEATEYPDENGSILRGAESLIGRILERAGLDCTYLLPRPSMGSACKRLNLMLRWLVRRDEVDPGGWDFIPSSTLVVPLDVHMYRAGRILGFTTRRSSDMRTALEITRGFREIEPEDPARYDFALTRLGIRKDCSTLAGLAAEIASHS